MLARSSARRAPARVRDPDPDRLALDDLGRRPRDEAARRERRPAGSAPDAIDHDCVPPPPRSAAGSDTRRSACRREARRPRSRGPARSHRPLFLGRVGSRLALGHAALALIQKVNVPACVGVPSMRQPFCESSLGEPTTCRPGGSEPGPMKTVTRLQPPANESGWLYAWPGHTGRRVPGRVREPERHRVRHHDGGQNGDEEQRLDEAHWSPCEAVAGRPNASLSGCEGSRGFGRCEGFFHAYTLLTPCRRPLLPHWRRHAEHALPRRPDRRGRAAPRRLCG